MSVESRISQFLHIFMGFFIDSLLNDTAYGYASIFSGMRKHSLWMAKTNKLGKISDLAQWIAQFVENWNNFPVSLWRYRFRNQVIRLEDRLLFEKVKSFMWLKFRNPKKTLNNNLKSANLLRTLQLFPLPRKILWIEFFYSVSCWIRGRICWLIHILTRFVLYCDSWRSFEWALTSRQNKNLPFWFDGKFCFLFWLPFPSVFVQWIKTEILIFQMR